MGDIVVGARVLTLAPKSDDREWTPEALKARRWGVLGRVVDRSDAHGECFAVRYDRDRFADPPEYTEGWFTRDELQRLGSEYDGPLGHLGTSCCDPGGPGTPGPAEPPPPPSPAQVAKANLCVWSALQNSTEKGGSK